MSAKRLYRVVATYPDGTAMRAHLQTRAAAEHRRQVVLGLWQAPGPGPTVTVEASDPITWPSDVVPEGPPQAEVLPLGMDGECPA